VSVDEEIRRFCMEAVKKGVRSIILFGSRAKGEHTEESDVDVCVVSSHLPGDVFRRRCLTPPGYSFISIMGFCPEEFLSMLDEENPLVLDIVKYGVALYDDGFFEKAKEVYLETIRKYGLERDSAGWTWKVKR